MVFKREQIMKDIIIVFFVILLVSGCSLKKKVVENKELIIEQVLDTVDLRETNKFKLFDKRNEICYVSSGELFFYDLKQKTSLKFPDESEIVQACFTDDNKTMYYTVFDDDNIWLKKAEFTDSTVSTIWLVNLQKPLSDFVTETYGEKGKMYIQNDTVFIECDYKWLDAFGKEVVYDIKRGKYSIYDGNKLYENYSTNYLVSKIQDFTKNVFIKGTVELFIYDEKGDSIQLSRTKEYDEWILQDLEQESEAPLEINMDNKYLCIIDISPDSSKVIFWFQTYMGDLSHGPYFVVNLDGKHQTLLLEDGSGSNNYPEWFDDNRLIFVAPGLYITEKNDNSNTEISSDADYYFMRYKK